MLNVPRSQSSPIDSEAARGSRKPFIQGVLLQNASVAIYMLAFIGEYFAIWFRGQRGRSSVTTGLFAYALCVTFMITTGCTGEPGGDTETENAESGKHSLGISRDKVKIRFEQHFENEGMAFQSTLTSDGNPAVIGTTDNRDLGVVLEGEESTLYYAAVTFSVAGSIPDDEMILLSESLLLLAEAIVPTWDRRPWLAGEFRALSQSGVANSETTHDGKLIKFVFAPVSEQVLFSIAPELDANTEPEVTPGPSTANERPKSGGNSKPGLGVSRLSMENFYEESMPPGYRTHPFRPFRDSSIKTGTVSASPDYGCSIRLMGPENDITSAEVTCRVDGLTNFDEVGLYMSALLVNVFPDWKDSITWISDALSKAKNAILKNAGAVQEVMFIDDKRIGFLYAPNAGDLGALGLSVWTLTPS